MRKSTENTSLLTSENTHGITVNMHYETEKLQKNSIPHYQIFTFTPRVKGIKIIKF